MCRRHPKMKLPTSKKGADRTTTTTVLSAATVAITANKASLLQVADVKAAERSRRRSRQSLSSTSMSTSCSGGVGGALSFPPIRHKSTATNDTIPRKPKRTRVQFVLDVQVVEVELTTNACNNLVKDDTVPNTITNTTTTRPSSTSSSMTSSSPTTTVMEEAEEGHSDVVSSKEALWYTKEEYQSMNQSILLDDPTERQRKIDVACTRRNFVRCILDLQEEQLSMNGGGMMLDPTNGLILACYACSCSKLSKQQATQRANDLAREVYKYLQDDIITETSTVIDTVLELVSCDNYDDYLFGDDDGGSFLTTFPPPSSSVILTGRPAMSQ